MCSKCVNYFRLNGQLNNGGDGMLLGKFYGSNTFDFENYCNKMGI